jgi:anti-sigma factor RsiW
MLWPLGGAPKHGECSELIVDYVAGTLDSNTEAAFRRHLESCAACCEAVAGQKAVWSALDEDLWLKPAVSPDFDQKLFERIGGAESRRCLALIGRLVRDVWRFPRQQFLNWTARKPGGVGVHAHQIENGWNKTQAVIRLLHLLITGNAGVGAARKQKDGVRGGAQERAVIASRIEIAHVEVPMIVGEEQEVGLSQATTALVETRQ